MENDDVLNEGAADEGGGELDFAEREFRAWCEDNDIDCAEEDMDGETRSDFTRIKKRFCSCLREKRLVTDGVKLVYKVSALSTAAGEEIVIRRPTGKDLMAMDGYKETQQMQKMQSFIASICGREKSFIARLDGKDYRFLQDIAALFLTA
jgi:hypothetical protein